MIRDWRSEIIYILLFISSLAIYFNLIRIPLSLQNSVFLMLSKLFLIIILSLVIYLFIKRLRYHVIRCATRSPDCPVCRHQLRQYHRKTYQRWLSYLIPLRRYSCPHCSWTGLKIYKPKRYVLNRGRLEKRF
ncbi:hypothetical protein PCC7418_2094 [Halothece sp. PCC 7418]|nr:hypothetical protein PCC7418_2094 [Halothece sp. PCC 7418]